MLRLLPFSGPPSRLVSPTAGRRAAGVAGLVALCAGLLAVPAAGGAVTGRDRAPAPTVTVTSLVRRGARPGPYAATMAVPVLRGGVPPATARINRALSNLARGQVAGFVHHLSRGRPPKGLPDISTLTSTVTTAMLTDRYVSFTEHLSSFQAGAAHPLDTVTTVTFDATTGAPVRLADLFRPGAPSLAVLSRQSRTLLLRQFGPSVLPSFLLDPGTAPKAANFAGWALSPFGLKLTFSDYAVGPYVVGTPSVMVPFGALRGVALPGGPLTVAAATRPVRMALLPATTPPAVDQCYQPAAKVQDNPPNACADGRLNVAAWDAVAGYAGPVLTAGAAATAHQVLLAACRLSAGFRLPAGTARSLVALAARYYGWRFSPAAALVGYPSRCPDPGAPASG